MKNAKGLLVGALALGGVMAMQASASAATPAVPQLTHVQPVGTQAATSTGADMPCYWGWHRHWGYHRYYGWHRPWGWHRGYGWHRHWGWHRGWHRW